MSDEEYFDQAHRDAVGAAISLTQAFVTKLIAVGMDTAMAIYEGYRYACEMLRMQGHRDPASRMAMAATILDAATASAGIQPRQQEMARQAEMKAYRGVLRPVRNGDDERYQSPMSRKTSLSWRALIIQPSSKCNA